MPLTIRYQVSMDDAHAHLFAVEMLLEPDSTGRITLQMPVWTPGSYLVREYSRHLQDFEATGEGPLHWQKVAKQTWEVETAGGGPVRIRYRIYANELTVRTSHLDSTHGYFNGASLFLYVPGLESVPHEVTIVPLRPDWRVTTPLALTETPYTYRAANYDELIDSPFEIGTHQVIPFTVLGKSHTLAIWGKSNLDYNRYLPDLENIIATEAKLFGGLPYDHYVFFCHFADSYGGLEHHNSTTLLYPRFELKADEKYFKFLNLTAHEFFHLWNVKRIRPDTLDRFDYTQENYTRSLWFMEGVTSYYDEIFPLRAEIYDAAHYLKLLAGHITRLQTTPGRLVQPLEESSFDTWIKLYRPNENSVNSQVSYYLKGQLVSCLLDLEIRLLSEGERSLDDVLRKLWNDYGSQGISFPESDLLAIIESVAGTSLADFFDRYLRSTDELDFDHYLASFGLKLVAQIDSEAPYLGIRTQEKEGRTIIQNVELGSPAQQAGLSSGDELLAIGIWKVTHGNFKDRLADLGVGAVVPVTFFRREELMSATVKLASSVPTGFTVEARDDATPVERERLRSWLGESVVSLTGDKSNR